MKNEQLIVPTIKQKQNFNYDREQSLEILKMNNTELMSRLKKITKGYFEYHWNPYYSYPKVHQELYKQDNSLITDLLFQLHVVSLDVDQAHAHFIIESLDDNGFLTLSDKEYCKQLHINNNQWQHILHELQKLEPTGVFAKNSLDSICIQLEQDFQTFALQILLNDQNALLNQDYSSLAKKYHTTIDEIYDAIDVIREQSPFPAAQYNSTTEELIIPDLEISIHDGKIQVRSVDIARETLKDFSFQISQDPILKDYFHHASILMEDITKRNKTLLFVMNEIIKIQEHHFLFGSPLKVCQMQDIAINLGINISTVSRCVSHKYYLFQDKIFSIKDLFRKPTLLEKNKNIINMLKNIIIYENKKAPYSDYELFLLLKREGFQISRRTIAKYREEANIPNSFKRKQLYDN